MPRGSNRLALHVGLVINSEMTTHQQLTRNEQEETGVTEDYVRPSICLEDAQDIREDIDQALKKP